MFFVTFGEENDFKCKNPNQELAREAKSTKGPFNLYKLTSLVLTIHPSIAFIIVKVDVGVGVVVVVVVVSKLPNPLCVFDQSLARSCVLYKCYKMGKT